MPLRHTLPARALLLLVALSSLSCTRSRLPFSNLETVTRIEVRQPVEAQTAYVIADSDRVARTVAAVRALDAHWQPVPVLIMAPQAVAAFYRDTALIGTVILGRDYLMAQGANRARIRSARPSELAPLAEALTP